MKRAMAIVGVAGCSGLLGLDNTTFTFKDAMTDAPSVCDGAPACSGASGRSLCGQLYGTGNAAGLLRAAAPTGAACPTMPTSSGPCQLAVFAAPTADYYARTGSNQVAGSLDDCGRFAINGISSSFTDLVVVAHDAPFVETATLVLGVGSAKVTNIAAYATGSDAVAAWGNQLAGSGSPPTITGGYLAVFDGAGSGEIVRVNFGSANPPPTVPWAAFFTGPAIFGTADPMLTVTGPSASALVMPPSGVFELGGTHMGRQCSQSNLQSVANVLMAITIPGC
jgi:hypothetical protein